MQIVSTVAELTPVVSAWKNDSHTIVLVPTMGNLHEGHLALIRHAKSCGDKIICSIFVNSKQFDRQDDLDAYPRTPKEDIEKLQELNVDLIFMPAHEEVYSRDNEIEVPEFSLSKELCGKYRPGFFEGITQVVARLFNMVEPHICVFGEKDYQQLVIVKKLVTKLGMEIVIESVPTVREEDGLALSSRNSYLNIEERARAPSLFMTLQNIKSEILSGEENFNSIENEGLSRLEEVGFRPDYVSIRNSDNLGPVSYDTENIIVLAAAWLGNARLIDNVLLQRS